MTQPADATLHEAINQLLDEAHALQDLERAMPLYERALGLAPDDPVVLYNIGLVHKYRAEWVQSLHYSRRASELRADDQAAHWNMGIAATALRDWPAAREAWRRAGINIPDGEGPIQDDFGLAPVRLNPDEDAEVVWGRRIDPVRVLIDNIPLPDSGFRAGDVVLHDGAPVGERMSRGRSYAIFNVLELFEASANSTYEAEVRTRDAEDLAALTAALAAAKVDHEVWTSQVRLLCKQCSEGIPHAHDAGSEEQKAEAAWPETHVIGISTTSPEAARRVLERWSVEGAGLLKRLVGQAYRQRLLSFECALQGSAVL